MAIPPPTPDKYLPNIVWMENKDVLIEFFKVIIISSVLAQFCRKHFPWPQPMTK